MMQVPNVVKENPLKSIAAFVSSVVVLLSAVFAVDTRYAHAKELEKIERQSVQQIIELQRSTLDDKVFELEIRKSTKPREWNQTDQLMLERYRKKLEDVDRQRSNTRVTP